MHRPLPSCPEAERELLGWVIGSQRDPSDVLAMVRADDFHDVKHAKIYEAIAELGKQRQTIDLVMVAEKMRSMGWLSILAQWAAMPISLDWWQNAATLAQTMPALMPSLCSMRRADVL